jgi:hypothetical protein
MIGSRSARASAPVRAHAALCLLLSAALGACESGDVLLGEDDGALARGDAALEDAGEGDAASDSDRRDQRDADTDGYDGKPEYCDPTACGIPPVSTFVLCPDGTLWIPVCVRDRDGRCRWEAGECDSQYQAPPDACGGCPPGEYCQVENCGRYGGPGVCRPRPYSCTRQYYPVCGCDGHTYGNDCVAAAAGVSIAHYGPC